MADWIRSPGECFLSWRTAVKVVEDQWLLVFLVGRLAFPCVSTYIERWLILLEVESYLSPLLQRPRPWFCTSLLHSCMLWSAVITGTFVTNQVLKFVNDFLYVYLLGQIQGSRNSILLTLRNEKERCRVPNPLGVWASPGAWIVAEQ